MVWLFLRTFLIEAFRIPSGSMENTLLIGDFLFVNKLLYGAEVPLINKRLPAVREPRRDDVVVFDSVEEEGLKVVKRLVGMPGDTLAMKSGDLWRNGARVEEPWARHGNPSAFADSFHRAKMRDWQIKYLAGGDPADVQPRSAGLGSDRRPRRALLHDGRQPGRFLRWPLLGIPAARKRPRPAPDRLLQLRLLELAPAAVFHRDQVGSDLRSSEITQLTIAHCERIMSKGEPAGAPLTGFSPLTWAIGNCHLRFSWVPSRPASNAQRAPRQETRPPVLPP